MYRKLVVLLIIIIITIFLQMSNKNENYRVNDIIKTLVRQSARWTTAARQDNNPFIAVLHANYGAAYLWALKDIATSQEMADIAGIDPIKFEREISNTQDMSSFAVLKVCPEFGPKKSYLTSVAGEG